MVEVLIIGDVNGRVKVKRKYQIVRQHGEKPENNNVMQSIRIKIIHTFFAHKNIHKYEPTKGKDINQ